MSGENRDRIDDESRRWKQRTGSRGPTAEDESRGQRAEETEQRMRTEHDSRRQSRG